MKQLRDLTQRSLEQARDIAIVHLVELQDERRDRRALEARLAQSHTLSLDRLEEIGRLKEQIAEIGPLKEQIAELEARLAQEYGASREGLERIAQLERAGAEAALLWDQLRAIQATVAWGAAVPIHRYIGARPRLHRSLRRLRAVVSAALARQE